MEVDWNYQPPVYFSICESDFSKVRDTFIRSFFHFKFDAENERIIILDEVHEFEDDNHVDSSVDIINTEIIEFDLSKREQYSKCKEYLLKFKTFDLNKINSNACYDKNSYNCWNKFYSDLSNKRGFIFELASNHFGRLQLVNGPAFCDSCQRFYECGI